MCSLWIEPVLSSLSATKAKLGPSTSPSMKLPRSPIFGKVGRSSHQKNHHTFSPCQLVVNFRAYTTLEDKQLRGLFTRLFTNQEHTTGAMQRVVWPWRSPAPPPARCPASLIPSPSSSTTSVSPPAVSSLVNTPQTTVMITRGRCNADFCSCPQGWFSSAGGSIECC
ncbi:hypothetical protein BDD12DRAFT_307050 [Trichophaea hybrida]|nr:hypothetical protein BDD12DRAFT_307050 [Trichophaea hybrida]